MNLNNIVNSINATHVFTDSHKTLFRIKQGQTKDTHPSLGISLMLKETFSWPINNQQLTPICIYLIFLQLKSDNVSVYNY